MSGRADVRAPPRRQERLLDPVVVLGICLWAAMLLRFLNIELAVTADEGYWMHRTTRFGAAVARGDLEGTYRSGHPGVTLMWVGLLGMGPARAVSLGPERYPSAAEFQATAGYVDAFWWARYAVAVVASGLLATCVGLAWKLLGAGPGLAGGLMVLLDPYVVGMSRLLHVDAMLAPLTTVAVLAGLVYWTGGRQRRYLALSGVAAGLAMLTKAPGLFLVVFVGALAIVAGRPRAGGRPALLPLLAWGALAAATYALLWPALWRDPIGTFGRVLGFALDTGLRPHDAPNYFLGRPLTSDPGPLYYPIALGLRLSPVALVGLAAVPIVLAGRRRTEDRGRRSHPLGPRSSVLGPLVWLLVWAGLFVALMTLGAKKFDRYMLPAIWTLDLLAGASLWVLAARLRRPIGLTLLGALLAVQVGLLWRAYPYPIAFYNPVLGGVATARETILIGWGEGLDQVVGYLNGLPNADRLLVATNYHHTVRPRFAGPTAAMRPYLSRRPGPNPPPTPNYYVIYVNSAQRRSVPPEVRPLASGGRPAFVAMVQGSPYAWVYRVPWAPEYAQRAPVPPPEGEEREEEE